MLFQCHRESAQFNIVSVFLNIFIYVTLPQVFFTHFASKNYPLVFRHVEHWFEIG